MIRLARQPGRTVAALLRAGLLAGLAVAVLAGCAAGQKAPAQQPTGHGTGAAGAGTAPSAAPCASYRCQPGPAQPLPGGYSVRLWRSEQPAALDPAAESSTPVLELSRDGQHLSWWVGRLGFGWAASLTCLATVAEPNCAVVATVGAHAGSAELMLLRDGSLVAPAAASAVFDSGAPVASDLDHDGQLDLLGVENDYQPNFAAGHNYWVSYRLVGDALRQTGCLPDDASHRARPATLLTGRCPVVAQG